MSVIARQDLPLRLALGGADVRSGELGDMIVTFYQVPKGLDSAPLLKGLPDDLCQCPHWGYVVKGKMLIHTKTGDELVEPGQAFHVEPGHIPEFLEDSEFVEFSPAAEFRVVAENMMRQGQAMLAAR